MPWRKVTYGRKSLFRLTVPEGGFIMVEETWQQAAVQEADRSHLQ